MPERARDAGAAAAAGALRAGLGMRSEADTTVVSGCQVAGAGAGEAV